MNAPGKHAFLEQLRSSFSTSVDFYCACNRNKLGSRLWFIVILLLNVRIRRHNNRLLFDARLNHQAVSEHFVYSKFARANNSTQWHRKHAMKTAGIMILANLRRRNISVHLSKKNLLVHGKLWILSSWSLEN